MGEYKLYLVDAKNTKLYTHPLNMVLVFNPYSKLCVLLSLHPPSDRCVMCCVHTTVVGSPTYIADEPMRKDLIENEAGAMWVRPPYSLRCAALLRLN